jgi:hypothetical protein
MARPAPETGEERAVWLSAWRAPRYFFAASYCAATCSQLTTFHHASM